jgi:tubulin monoglycylase TTLL3/8
MKPENENRGTGIEVVTSYKEILNTFTQKQKSENYVLQKYIEQPLLYYGRKFDIRVLALIDNEKNLWHYKPCYLRTSSNKYTLDNNNKFVHLTNNCFQMKSEEY